MNLDQILTKGTKLTNKRSGRTASIIDAFPTLGQRTNWQVVMEYRLYDGKRFSYVMETELNRWEIIPPSKTN